MESNWASEHLQTIRTLMERSAVYRRALAPIMLAVGTVGVAAAVLGIALKLDAFLQFAGFWLGTAVVAVGGAFFIARRQAIKEHEPFWSPPTRRVAQALAPAFAATIIFSLLLFNFNIVEMEPVFVIVSVLFYGCAIHAAGFFMLRGIKLFAWVIIGLGTFVSLALYLPGDLLPSISLSSHATLPALPAFILDRLRSISLVSHALMGFFFGVLHLAYGVYLYLTEKPKNAA